MLDGQSEWSYTICVALLSCPGDTDYWLAYACCALDDENLACMYHPCSQNMLLSFDLLILILSWISSPVWGSRKGMTRNSGEAPKKVPPHCLGSRDFPACFLPCSSHYELPICWKTWALFFSGKLTYNFHPTEGHSPSLLMLLCISSFCVWLSSGYSMSIDWCHAPRHCCVSA